MTDTLTRLEKSVICQIRYVHKKDRKLHQRKHSDGTTKKLIDNQKKGIVNGQILQKIQSFYSNIYSFLVYSNFIYIFIYSNFYFLLHFLKYSKSFFFLLFL